MSRAVERHRVRSGSPFEEPIGFCRAIRVGNQVLVSGTAPVWPDGTCDPDPERQAARCFEIITAALTELGARSDQVVRTRMYIVNPADWDAIGRAHGAAFRASPPASTMVVVRSLLDKRWKVEVEAEAIVDDGE